MKIYSINEIIKATNNFLDTDHKTKSKDNIPVSNDEIPINTQKIIKEAEITLIKKKQNTKYIETTLLLKNEIPTNNKINSFNFNINIKPEVKNHMINELYIFLKKKIKKNTLRLIIDDQLEIKNYKNKITFLKQREMSLTTDYEVLKDNYQSLQEINIILKTDNNNLQNNLDKINENTKYLETENKKIKTNLGEFQENNKKLNIDNKNLQNNFEQVSIAKELIDKEIKLLKMNFNKQKISQDEFLMKNRSLEINNNELKKTLSRYIVNYKKIQENSISAENLQNSKTEEVIQKVKFYQDENIRLSSELFDLKRKNETIKINLDNIELEKQKISNKIKELNNAITGKSNVVSSQIIKEVPTEVKKEINALDDTEHKSLDEVISRIFSKI